LVLLAIDRLSDAADHQWQRELVSFVHSPHLEGFRFSARGWRLGVNDRAARWAGKLASDESTINFRQNTAAARAYGLRNTIVRGKIQHH
jgi:hypothetical protein